MKLLHISDLHLGIKLHEYSLIEEQAYILGRILELIIKESPDAVAICGDVYDTQVPPTEAVRLFDSFITKLCDKKVPVLIISGNHDSADRVSFGSGIMNRLGVYISPAYSGDINPVIFNDEYGEVRIYMLPFVRPANVRACFDDEEITSYTDAFNSAVKHMNLDSSKRNILLAHQFIGAASVSESEEPITVGTAENISLSSLDPFDFTALGHLHNPQDLGTKAAYSGSPLKYSFSEAKRSKSVSIIEIGAKGIISHRTDELLPLHDLLEIKGSFSDLTSSEFISHFPADSFLHITLTDEQEIMDAMQKLRYYFPRLLKLDYDNTTTRNVSDKDLLSSSEGKSPADLAVEFYNARHGKLPDNDTLDYLTKKIREIWSDDK
jgi:exonuclease SbcD